MRVLGVFLLLVAAVYCRPQSVKSLVNNALAYITKYESDQNPLGEYTYTVHSSDGQERSETRRVINPGTDKEEAIVEGYYSYPGEDGKPLVVGYRSDKDGFQPEGEHLVPSANVKRRKPTLGIPSAAVASLAGGGLGK